MSTLEKQIAIAGLPDGAAEEARRVAAAIVVTEREVSAVIAYALCWDEVMTMTRELRAAPFLVESKSNGLIKSPLHDMLQTRRVELQRHMEALGLTVRARKEKPVATKPTQAFDPIGKLKAKAK